MDYTIKEIEKNVIEITVTLPSKKIASSYDEIVGKTIAELEVEGFRRGKAPREVAEKHINREEAYNKALNALLPSTYEEIIKHEKLKPIVNPQVKLLSAKEGEDWTLTITVITKPSINVPNYKELVQKVKKELKSSNIWVPGKDIEEGEKKKKEAEIAVLNKILDSLLSYTDITLPSKLIETELNKKMSSLIDELQKAGLTMDAYCQSKNTTPEALRKRFAKEIEDTYKIEFILNEIADKESITVGKEDLESFIAGIKEETARKQAQENAYFYASMIRRQKLLDFLIGL